MRRHRMSRSSSRKSFTRGANRVHRKNFSHVPMPGSRGGLRG